MKKIYLLVAILFAIEALGYGQNANASLSNLSASTAVNHSLQPNATASKNLGSPAKKWKNLYLSGKLTSDSGAISNGLIVYNGGVSAFNGNPGGYGIYGSGGSYGIYGNGTFYGLWGNADTAGVYGLGNDFGVFGQSHNGAGIYGISLTGNGVYGASGTENGGSFVSLNGTALKALTVFGAYAAEFDGDVYTTGSYTASDKNLKQNIEDVSSALNIINRLKPKNYDYKSDTKYSSLHLPKGKHYGLIAQDLEQVLPGLVKESSHEIDDQSKLLTKASAGVNLSPAAAVTEQQTAHKESITIKAVNYTELIPIMIKGIQELSAKNDEKDKLISELQNEVNDLKVLIGKKGNVTPAIYSGGYLKQNLPNPATNNTIINYHLPANTGMAKISVTDIKGSVLKVYDLSEAEGSLNIKSGELPAGTYTYTLFINDQEADSKEMIITK